MAPALHTAQAIAIVVLANPFSLPVRATYMTSPPGPDVGTKTITLFDLVGEQANVALSMVAKSMLAWQSSASTLASR